MRHPDSSKWFVALGIAALACALPYALAAQESGGEQEQAEEASKKKKAEKGEKKEKQDEQKEDEPEVDARSELRTANRLAGRGALTRSISHYEKVLKHGVEQPLPDYYTSAQLNFAQVLLALEKWKGALKHFQAYLSVAGESASGSSKAKKGISKAKARIWDKKLAKLSVDIEPEKRSRIYIDGFLFAQGEDLDDLTLTDGEYTVRGEAVDHNPDETTVKLEMKDDEEGQDEKKVELRPEEKTFYGRADIQVNVDGATVRFKPDKLKSPGEPGTIERKSPMEEPEKLIIGKWLLEVNKDDYHRWVRYIKIKRDKTNSVQVELDKKLPEEIR